MFKSRFYKKIEDCGTSIKKSSIKSSKLLEEIEFYKRIPKEFSQFFPKLLREGTDNGETFYFIEKIKGKNASEEFLTSNAIDNNWEKLFALTFSFISDRPVKQQSSIESCKYLYFEKVFERANLLKTMSLYDQLKNHVIYHHFLHKYENVLERYFDLVEKFLKPCDYLAYHHGDFCLTNMFLVDGQLKLIDPRGYDEKFKNMHDPMYDVAKFSHSILGNYDRILANDYDIALKDKDFPFELKMQKLDLFQKSLFKWYLNEYKFDYYQIRLREASLFLSLLPLHPEDMRRIAAFILQAELIITELEKKYA